MTSVSNAAALCLTIAFMRHVSGESAFLSKQSSSLVSSGPLQTILETILPKQSSKQSSKLEVDPRSFRNNLPAALSEEGYQQVASLKNDEQMTKFVLYLLHTDGFEADTSDLHGFVPWYSGTRAVQSLGRLREELFTKPWVRRISPASFIEAAQKPTTDFLASSKKRDAKKTLQGKELKQNKSSKAKAQEEKQERTETNKSIEKVEVAQGSLGKLQKHNSAVSERPKLAEAEAHANQLKNHKNIVATETDKKAALKKPVGASSLAKAKYASNIKTHTVAPTAHQQPIKRKHSPFKASQMLALRAKLSGASQAFALAEADEPADTKPSPGAVMIGSARAESTSAAARQVNVVKAEPLNEAIVTVLPEIKNTSKQASPDETLHAAEPPKVAQTWDGKASHDAKVALEANTSQISEDKLPEVPSLLDKSNQILEALSKQVNMLKEHLAEAESENQMAVARVKASYERQLEHQHENTTAMQKVNEQLSKEISSLVNENAQLRTRAIHLKDTGNQLRMHALRLKDNFTTAQEFAADSLNADSDDGTQLLVLRELDEQDAALSESKEHASALHQVGKVALFQLSPNSTASNPLEVVRSLGKRFGDLDHEKAASMAVLTQSFVEQSSKEAQRQNVLEEQTNQLKVFKDGQLVLRGKLQAAVDHLEHVVSTLEQQIQGVQEYAVRLSS